MSLITHHFAETWRLIPAAPFDGPANMAIDEALLTRVGEGKSPPTLRFYTWTAPWVSLGSAQPSGDLDPAALAARGWGLLRRASGGTAVLHQGQLGYALILPADHPLWQGDLASSYRRLAEPLARGFASLGATVEAAPPSFKDEFAAGAPALATRTCFGALGPYELLDRQGRKLIGNSQIRRRSGVIQHGTLQLSGSQSELANVLSQATRAERADLIDYLARRVGSLEESIGHAISPAEVADALATAFADVLGVQLVIDTLTSAECHAAEELVATKYGDSSWTYRR